MNGDGSRLTRPPAAPPAATAGGNGAPPPEETVLRVVHAAVPGRVRLAVPRLKRDPGRTRSLEALAATWQGVLKASANAATGNLLLEFDPLAVSVERLEVRVRSAASQASGRSRRAPAGEPQRTNGRRRTAETGEITYRAPRGSSHASRASTGSAPASLPADLLAVLEAAPVPPPPRPRVRAMEAALGAAVLAGAGALLLTARTHGHNLAFDQAPLALAAEIHSPALTAFMRGASRLVEPGVLLPATLGASVLGVGRQAPGEAPWLAPAAVVGGGVVITVLKTLLRRGRPAAFEPLVRASGYSLPSGHAFLAMTLYGLLAHHGLRWLRVRRPDDRRVAGLLLVAASTAVLLVGASRVYLGVHYPTDVLAGYALALLWLFILAGINDGRWLLKKPREKGTG